MQTLPHLIFLSLQIYDIISQNQTLQSFVAIISKILFYTNPLQETEPFSKHAHILYFSWKIRHTFFAEFKKCTTFASAIKQHGRLAQLVQSIWFTPRGSGVRIPQRPQPKKAKRRREKDKPVSIKHLQVFSLYFSSQKMTPKSQKKIEKSY